jgi:hypothetical protein
VSLELGEETNVIVDQINYKKLAYPYSNPGCIANVSSENSFDSDLYRQTIKLMRVYDQKNCLLLCFDVYLYERCKCWDVTQVKLDYFTVKCNRSQLDCTFAAYNRFYSEGDITTEGCFAKCPPECSSVEFDLTVVQSAYPSPYYANLLMSQYASSLNGSSNEAILKRNFTSLENIRRSSLAANVYFEDISYTLVNEEPERAPEDLVAYLGGFMGLCMGASLLSLAELLEVGFNMMIILFRTRGRVIQAEKK